MNIGKAIEVLEAEFQTSIEKNEPSNPNLYSKSPVLAAIKLGIEALKRVKAKRLHFEVDIDRLLTGETREGK